MVVFNWLNDQLLKMNWLSELVRKLIEDVFGLSTAERVGGSIHFFIYDTIKIFILLSVLIFAISYVQSYFPPERTKRILGRHKGIGSNILGALLGTITPFCSCSSIPLFIGFHKSGAADRRNVLVPYKLASGRPCIRAAACKHIQLENSACICDFRTDTGSRRRHNNGTYEARKIRRAICLRPAG